MLATLGGYSDEDGSIVEVMTVAVELYELR